MQALPWGEDKKKPTPRHAKQAPSIICTQYAAAFSILVVVVLAAVAAAVLRAVLRIVAAAVLGAVLAAVILSVVVEVISVVHFFTS